MHISGLMERSNCNIFILLQPKWVNFFNFIFFSELRYSELYNKGEAGPNTLNIPVCLMGMSNVVNFFFKMVLSTIHH